MIAGSIPEALTDLRALKSPQLQNVCFGPSSGLPDEFVKKSPKMYPKHLLVKINA
jgi:hypothetical protein